MAFLNGNQTQSTLLRLIKKCQSFSIITAWATPNDVFTAIKDNIQKCDEIIIGVDFYQTSPEVLKWLKQNTPNKTRIGQCANGVFHPKTYIFDLGAEDTRTTIIGSANMTNSAFTKNDEFCVSVNAKIDRLNSTLKTWRKNSIPINQFDLDDYTREYNTKGAQIRVLSRTPRSTKRKNAFIRYPNLLTLSFDDYDYLCTQEIHPRFMPSEPYDQRINLLDYFLSNKTNILADHNVFCCFAGVSPINGQNPANPYGGWFGVMQAGAAFRKTAQDLQGFQQLGTLINTTIPTSGSVTKNGYYKFLNGVNNIVNTLYGAQYNKLNHFAAATRLLSMWRPDFFFCLNGANKEKIAYDFDMPVGGNNGIFTPDGYWDAAEALRNSTWATAPFNATWTPNKQTCWNGRIAMIDALYY